MSGGSFAGPYSGNDSESIEWDLVGKDLTITCWVKIPNDVTWNSLGSFGILATMADLGNHNSAKSGLSIGAGNTGYPNWYAAFKMNIAPQNSWSYAIVSTTYKGGSQLPITWADDDWHLITATYKFGATDNADFQVYFDNAQTLGAATSAALSGTAISTSGWTTIPGRRSGLGGSLTTSGGTTSYKQREFVIWDRILTPAERTTVYNSGVPLGNTASYPSGAVTGWMFENNIDVDPTYYNSQQEYTGRVTLKNAFDNSKYAIVSNYDVFNRIPSSYNSVQTNHISIPQVQNNPGISDGMTTANLVNSDLTRSIPYSSYSMEFDGTDQYIDITNTDLGLNNTTSIWFKRSATGTHTLLGSGSGGSWNNYTIQIQSTGKIRYANEDINYVEFDNATTQSIINTTDTWINIIIIRSGADANLYVNSVDYDGTKTFSSGTTVATVVNTIAASGGASGGEKIFEFAGSLSNCSIYNSTLTQDQILTIYNGGVPNSVSSLSPVSWWSLAGDSYYDGTNWICPDLGSGGNNGTSANMAGTELVGDAPGGSANGIATNMDIPTNLKGDAPNSFSNAFSVNMDSQDRVASVPS